jgi:tetratricopeptide (TPR) repeat protein
MKSPSKATIVALMLLLCGTTISAEDQTINQLEAKIAAEMEALLDKTGAISRGDEQACEKLIQQGIQEHDKGDFRKAIEFYEKALKKNPISSLAYYEMGYSYSLSGDKDKALESMMRSIALDPKSETAYVMKANILDDKGYPDEAIKTYRKILELKPDNAFARVNLGITLVRKGNIEEAQSEFTRAHEIAPDHPSPFFNLARIAKMKGDRSEEERLLKEFVRVGKNDRRLPTVQERLKELQTGNMDMPPQQKSDAAKSIEKLHIDIKELPGFIILAGQKSKLTYEIGNSTPEEGARFRKQEGDRFKELFKKGGDGCVSKQAARDALKVFAQSTDYASYMKVLRAFFPEDEEWAAIIKMSSSFGKRYRDLAPPISASGFIAKKNDTIQVKTVDTSWIIYFMAKALWRYEPGFRQRFGGPDDDKPSLAEEEFALLALIGGRKNALEKKDKEAAADQYVATISEIFDSNAQLGFVLMEILHKSYGVSLECLTAEQAGALRSYFSNFALEPVK